MARFHGHQSVQLSADICHSSGDHHASGSDDLLTTFVHMHDAQTGLTFGCLYLAVGWQGAGCGAYGPIGVQAYSWPFGQSLNWSASGERGQVLKESGKGKQSDSHVKPFKSMEVGHRQD